MAYVSMIVFTYQKTLIPPLLIYLNRCITYTQERIEQKTKGGIIMTDTKDYVESEEEREEGHVDTRKKNFECEDKDPNLGCDMGIDVAG